MWRTWIERRSVRACAASGRRPGARNGGVIRKRPGGLGGRGRRHARIAQWSRVPGPDRARSTAASAVGPCGAQRPSTHQRSAPMALIGGASRGAHQRSAPAGVSPKLCSMNAKSVSTSLGKAWSNSAQLRSDGDAMCTCPSRPSASSTHTSSSPCGASAQAERRARAGRRQRREQLSVVAAQPVDRLAHEPQRLGQLAEAHFDASHRVPGTLADQAQPQAPVAAVRALVTGVGRDARAARQRPDRAVLLDERAPQPARPDQPVGHRGGPEEHAPVATQLALRAHRARPAARRDRSRRPPAHRPARSSRARSGCQSSGRAGA